MIQLGFTQSSWRINLLYILASMVWDDASLEGLWIRSLSSTCWREIRRRAFSCTNLSAIALASSEGMSVEANFCMQSDKNKARTLLFFIKQWWVYGKKVTYKRLNEDSIRSPHILSKVKTLPFSIEISLIFPHIHLKRYQHFASREFCRL